jgi:subtilisin family serine protease
MTRRTIRIGLLPLAVSLLAACDGSSGTGAAQTACAESGPYACKTGSTEPLYAFQWALNYDASFFKDYPDTFSGGLDLNVEPPHRQGIKGQDVNVLVLDSGTDLHNEDLAPNADRSMSWNYLTETDDPFPVKLDPNDAPHGTVVAGIIAAAQNGKGVLGVAPRVRLGAANLLEGQNTPNAYLLAYGNAPWSSKAHVFNASFGSDEIVQAYESETDSGTSAIRGLKNLREGKGALFLKAAGNEFRGLLCGLGPAYYDCTNPANDRDTLESHIITVAALNAKGSASSYSSAGSVVWITGMGGEYGNYGTYGEMPGPLGNDGPTIFSTDIRGCIEGYSRTGARTPFLRGQTEHNGKFNNTDCDYTYMNGTSAATPTIAGVAALMLSANPDLTWRDARDILRLSARKVDPDYVRNIPHQGDRPFGALYDLDTHERSEQIGTAADIYDGATRVPIELGWQKNAAGYDYSNWYGFGVPDTERVVALAQEYARQPAMSRGDDVKIPDFAPVAVWYDGTLDPDFDLDAPKRTGPFPYTRVTSIGKLKSDAQIVDQFQVRLRGQNVCLGSLGIAVKSPAGTVSLLKLFNDHFKADALSDFTDYGLASFAFYGEPAEGDWEIFAVASNPAISIQVGRVDDNGDVEIGVSKPCPASPADFQLATEARIIAQ